MSELGSSTGCSDGCGTTSDVETSSDEDDEPPKKKRRKNGSGRGQQRGRHGKSSQRGRGSRGGQRGRGKGRGQRGRGSRGGRGGQRGRGRQRGKRQSAGESDELQWMYGEVQHSAEGQATPRNLPRFSSSCGPTLRTKQATTPLQVLQLFLTKAILEEIVRQTKIFAAQKKADFEFCYEELLAFIGITIAMGLLKLPQIRDYWSKHEILATPWFPAIMSRDRYFQILQYLHLVDSSQQKKRVSQDTIHYTK